MSVSQQREFWPLMALACAPDGVLSPIQVQKALFLVMERAGRHIGDIYEFEPHNYGPFSVDIYRDIDSLMDKGWVTSVPNQFHTWNSYGVTEDGRKEAEKARDELEPKVAKFLGDVVTWVVKQDFPDLLRAIYDEYPAYAANSVFQGR